MQYDVFLSYASQERPLVDRLAAYLKYYNITVFVAHRDIPSDVAWANGIAEAVRNSRMVLALYSDNFNSAPWLDRELSWAQSSAIPIMTVCLTSAPYSENKIDYLQGTLCVDAVGDEENRFPAIYEEVCNMLAMPIEQALPVAEVLPQISSEPQEVEESVQKEINPVKEKKEVAAPSHHLLRAAVIGVLLMLIALSLLEYLLK